MKGKILDTLHQLITENPWDGVIPEQARAVFTTFCILYNVEADTKVCDEVLIDLYNGADLGECMGYNEFEDFMLSLIV